MASRRSDPQTIFLQEPMNVRYHLGSRQTYPATSGWGFAYARFLKLGSVSPDTCFSRSTRNVCLNLLMLLPFPSLAIPRPPFGWKAISFGWKPHPSFGWKPLPFGWKHLPFGWKPLPTRWKPLSFRHKPLPTGRKPLFLDLQSHFGGTNNPLKTACTFFGFKLLKSVRNCFFAVRSQTEGL